MLELNSQQASEKFIIDGTDSSFMVDVIEHSQKIPVIVDFWAQWCGPCKTLGPVLEKEITAAKGKIRLVKIDIDKNAAIAGQLQVQSIPTIYAFHKGRPVDAFQGNVTQSEIKKFITKLLKLSGDEQNNALEETLLNAETMLEQGAYVEAIQTFGMILGQMPDNAPAYSGLVRAYLGAKDLTHAKGLLDNAPETIAQNPEINAARAQLELAELTVTTQSAEELRLALSHNPKNAQIRFDLAMALYSNSQTPDAIAELLELLRSDFNWNEGAAKKRLLKIFDTLKPDDPLVLDGRRQLSSIIFT